MASLKTVLLLSTVIVAASCDIIDPASKARKLNQTGLQFSEKGDKKQAIQYFIEASEVSGIPTSEKVIYLENVGSMYWNDQDDSAIFYYTGAAQLDNKNSYRGLYDLAIVSLLKRQTPKAIDQLIRACELDETGIEANNLLGLVYLGEYGEEYLDATKALKYNLVSYNKSKTVPTEFALAKNYYRLNDMKKAVPLFEDISQRSPGQVPYLNDLAMIYLEQGRTEEANRVLAEIKDKDENTYQKIINSHIKTGDHGIVWR